MAPAPNDYLNTVFDEVVSQRGLFYRPTDFERL